MSSFKHWLRVPDGARFELEVESESDTFVASARLVDDRGREESWVDADLVPGPKRKTIRAPRDWAVRVRVAFTGRDLAHAIVRARLEKPDGSTHGRPFACEMSGRSGEIRRATVVITTRQS